jgi:hypothetical protein
VRDQLRHWVVLDLAKFREDIDYYVTTARPIDNHDGTYGLAFNLRSMAPEMILAASDTMRSALDAGSMETIQPLPTAEYERVLTPPPLLKDLIAQYGGYDRITPKAWAKWDADQAAWQERQRYDGNAQWVKVDDIETQLPAMGAHKLKA